MLKIAICDDDVEFTCKMEKIIRQTACENGFQLEIDVYSDGSKLIEKNKVNPYDVIFLDIKMQKMDGLKIARLIRETNELVYLIFVTNHSEYAIEAYEVQPFRFLLKPIDEEVVKTCFLKACDKISSGLLYFEYKFNKVYHKIPIKDIVYFQSHKRVIQIHLVDGSVEFYYDKLGVVEEKIKQYKVKFLRIHRSFLVNARYIRKKEYDKVVLSNGTEHFISEDRRKELNMQYGLGRRG